VLSPALPNSGNYHVFYRLPVTTSTVAKINTIVCLLGGSNICAFKLSGYSSCLKKNTPTPELNNAQQRSRQKTPRSLDYLSRHPLG
jgi:hypothetical protein